MPLLTSKKLNCQGWAGMNPILSTSSNKTQGYGPVQPSHSMGVSFGVPHLHTALYGTHLKIPYKQSDLFNLFKLFFKYTKISTV